MAGPRAASGRRTRSSSGGGTTGSASATTPGPRPRLRAWAAPGPRLRPRPRARCAGGSWAPLLRPRCWRRRSRPCARKRARGGGATATTSPGSTLRTTSRRWTATTRNSRTSPPTSSPCPPAPARRGGPRTRCSWRRSSRVPAARGQPAMAAAGLAPAPGAARRAACRPRQPRGQNPSWTFPSVCSARSQSGCRSRRTASPHTAPRSCSSCRSACCSST
mmetsp:Transcript_73042/g.236275  ORF Transcript_73042/g.236275 Transcript_73042/m.236275 type:complete len:219 (-) Transcript_73042:827-1483(-)